MQSTTETLSIYVQSYALDVELSFLRVRELNIVILESYTFVVPLVHVTVTDVFM